MASSDIEESRLANFWPMEPQTNINTVTTYKLLGTIYKHLTHYMWDIELCVAKIKHKTPNIMSTTWK